MISPPRPTAADTARGQFLRVHLPKAALGVLLALSVLFVVTAAGDYGRTWDEGLQNAYGWSVLRWYQSGGADAEFMTWWSALHMPEHGPFFETVIAVGQSATGELWLTRSIMGTRSVGGTSRPRAGSAAPS